MPSEAYFLNVFLSMSNCGDHLAVIETIKIIINEDDNYAPGSSYAEYRKIPNDLFSSVPFYVYGDTLAIMVFEGEPSIIALHYPAIAHAYRVQFEDMWNRSNELHGPSIIREVQGSGA